MIPEEYKDKKILIVGDAESVEKEYLLKKGFRDVISTDLYYPSEGQFRLDIERSFLDERFDLIFISHVLEHCIFLFRAIRNIRKMLKDDGVVYIFTPNESDGWRLLYHYYSFNFEGWKELFKRAFLTPIREGVVNVINRQNYFYVLRKIKIGAIVRCYYLTDFLDKVLKNIRWVDKIVLANFRYKGVEPMWDDTELIYRRLSMPNVVLKKGEDLEQHEVFNLCMQELKDYDYVFINDADEIVLPYDQIKIITEMLNTKKDAGVITVLDYAKDFYHTYPIRTHKPIIIVKSNCVWKEGDKRTPDYGEGVVFDKIYLHHFGYIVKDLQWKIRNAWHTNKQEVAEMTSREVIEREPPQELLEILEVK